MYYQLDEVCYLRDTLYGALPAARWAQRRRP